MRIICTTSNRYLHILPIFCFLFNRNWSDKQEVEIVGYDEPDFELPENFKFHSLGAQVGDTRNFGTDLKKYFEKQDDWFIWMMEDTFIKEVDFEKLEFLKLLTLKSDVINTVHGTLGSGIGRINLSHATMLQENFPTKLIKDSKYQLFENTETALYRLCTQPSIWNKKFLLQYLQPNMSPWEFETQSCFNDGWKILGLENPAVIHNEGVTKHDIHKYNFKGIPEEVIAEMKDLKIC